MGTKEINKPPHVFIRNKYGLIEDETVTYHFNEDGTVNWRKMIKTEFLVANRDRTDETDISKLEDNELIILLGGLKDLANIRGYQSVTYDIHEASPEYVCASCTITWIGNYETGQGEPVVFESVADAGIKNTEGFGQMYLAAIAENRAFCRAVRNFLRINIVAKEEIKNVKTSAPTPSSNAASPDLFLKNLMKEKKITFDTLKIKMVNEKVDGADSWSTTKDIPRLKMFEIIERMQKKAAK
jgi:hypothetical protein|tara:strand:- start:165 stop:887 length:723 start_codon:yes stop_codon:yes gene_type:complete